MSGRILFASDLHGDAECVLALIRAFEREGADRLILLGDILYHGPRNDLPAGYAPKKVIALLNPLADRITAVRGNCDAEVDSMVLDFEIAPEYIVETHYGHKVYLTHGHRINAENIKKLPKGSIAVAGHTHVYGVRKLDGDSVYINPGSVSIPKETGEKTYMTLSDGVFEIKTLDGRLLLTYKTA